MTNVIFNSGLMGLLIWVLLFAVSTAALAIFRYEIREKALEVKK